MAEELLKTGKHVVTAISRQDSKAIYAEGIKIARVDYDNHQSIVEALRGQDALIITLSAVAPHDLEARIVKAAAEANVPWILPNEWGPDAESEALLKDLAMLWGPKKKTRELIKSIGKSSYISVSTGCVAFPYVVHSFCSDQAIGSGMSGVWQSRMPIASTLQIVL